MNNPTDLTRPDALRLHLGEMTAQELRTAQAAVRFTLSQVRQQDAATDAGAELAAWAADMEASGAVALGGGAWEWNAETPEFLFQLWRRARHATAQDAEQERDAEIDAYAIPGEFGTRIERVRQIEGPALWAVRRHGLCLSTSGDWDWEPLPSSRTDEWIATHRFSTARSAIDAARAQRAGKEQS